MILSPFCFQSEVDKRNLLLFYCDLVILGLKCKCVFWPKIIDEKDTTNKKWCNVVLLKSLQGNPPINLVLISQFNFYFTTSFNPKQGPIQVFRHFGHLKIQSNKNNRIHFYSFSANFVAQTSVKYQTWRPSWQLKNLKWRHVWKWRHVKAMTHIFLIFSWFVGCFSVSAKEWYWFFFRNAESIICRNMKTCWNIKNEFLWCLDTLSILIRSNLALSLWTLKCGPLSNQKNMLGKSQFYFLKFFTLPEGICVLNSPIWI